MRPRDRLVRETQDARHHECAPALPGDHGNDGWVGYASMAPWPCLLNWHLREMHRSTFVIGFADRRRGNGRFIGLRKGVHP